MANDEYSSIYRNLFNQSVMKGNYLIRNKQTHELICTCESLHNANLIKHTLEDRRPSLDLEIIDCTISL